MTRRIVIDAHRIFSELIAGNRRLRQVFTARPDWEFFCPKYVFVERFKHKERIAEASGLDEAALLAPLHTLLNHIRFICIGSWTESWPLCRDVDENDAAYVALTLELDEELWTGDRQLEAGLRKKGFSRFFDSTEL